MFDQLAQTIARLLNGNAPVVVGICGFGGSGKSTLAQRLRRRFPEDSAVVGVDQLYSDNPMGPEILDQTNWDLMEIILADTRAGKPLRFVGKDFDSAPVVVDQTAPRLLIVEGVKLFQPRLMPYFDVSVWIDCPHERALERAKSRDRMQGESDSDIARWDSHWGPIELRYVQTYQPRTMATFLYQEWDSAPD